MGETHQIQPLTREDMISVVIYRAGIFISTLIIGAGAFLALQHGMSRDAVTRFPIYILNLLLLSLYFSVGLSVFFIHLYVGKFHRALKKIYYASVVCLAVLFFIGHGNPAITMFRTPPYAALLLIPLSLCLGFITAKEAFCFRLFEGYILAIIMPAYILFYAVGLSTGRGTIIGLMIVAVLLLVFTFRKVFMPLHFDIGDKSAYQQ